MKPKQFLKSGVHCSSTRLLPTVLAEVLIVLVATTPAWANPLLLPDPFPLGGVLAGLGLLAAASLAGGSQDTGIIESSGWLVDGDYVDLEITQVGTGATGLTVQLEVWRYGI